MIRDGRKYLRFFNPKTRDLTGRRVFDLIQDPRETRSLGDDFEEMAPRLNDLAGFHGLKFTARFDPVRKDLNRNLRTLGYLK
jgi:hypothetical protein